MGFVVVVSFCWSSRWYITRTVAFKHRSGKFDLQQPESAVRLRLHGLGALVRRVVYVRGSSHEWCHSSTTTFYCGLILCTLIWKVIEVFWWLGYGWRWCCTSSWLPTKLHAKPSQRPSWSLWRHGRGPVGAGGISQRGFVGWRSVVLLPALKPACSSAMIFSAYGFSLFRMIFSMTLLAWPMRLIVRYCCRLP